MLLVSKRVTQECLAVLITYRCSMYESNHLQTEYFTTNVCFTFSFRSSAPCYCVTLHFYMWETLCTHGCCMFIQHEDTIKYLFVGGVPQWSASFSPAAPAPTAPLWSLELHTCGRREDTFIHICVAFSLLFHWSNVCRLSPDIINVLWMSEVEPVESEISSISTQI